MEATGAEKGMFSEEEQFYAYTEQSEESEVSTAGKVMWKTNIISVRKKTSDIHLPFVRKQRHSNNFIWVNEEKACSYPRVEEMRNKSMNIVDVETFSSK